MKCGRCRSVGCPSARRPPGSGLAVRALRSTNVARCPSSTREIGEGCARKCASHRVAQPSVLDIDVDVLLTRGMTERRVDAEALVQVVLETTLTEPNRADRGESCAAAVSVECRLQD